MPSTQGIHSTLFTLALKHEQIFLLLIHPDIEVKINYEKKIIIFKPALQVLLC